MERSYGGKRPEMKRSQDEKKPGERKGEGLEEVKMSRKMQFRAEKIMTAALQMFCEKGIEETSMEDVAKLAQTGVATVYRYFGTKARLAVQSGTAYWKRVSEKYEQRLLMPSYFKLDGVHQMSVLLEIFVQIFENERPFLKFLQEFDLFVRQHQISPEELTEYESCILNLKPYVTDALNKGLEDRTLAFPWSVDEVYFSLMHAMLSLMQKLAVNGQVLASDASVALPLQIKITGELMLRGLENKKKGSF